MLLQCSQLPPCAAPCPTTRRRLVAAAGSLQQLVGSEEGYEDLELPSLSAAWFLGPGSEGSPEVRHPPAAPA